MGRDRVAAGRVDPRIRIGWRPCSYEPSVFSSRVRALLPARYLRRAGYPSRVMPPDGSGDYDLVVFQKAYRPLEVEMARRLKERGIAVILDICDNHLYNPNGDPQLAERAARLEEMIELADAITVSSLELARLFSPRRSFLVHDALGLPPWRAAAVSLRRARRSFSQRGIVRLVWHGQSGSENPPSGVFCLKGLVPELNRLHRTLPIRLDIITNSRTSVDEALGGASFPTRFVVWRPQRFAFDLTANDICVLPIDVNPFTVCKTANRVISSLALGVPVVATKIPSYREMADWMLFDAWAENITAYATDPALARTHVAGAQRQIFGSYTRQRVVDEWLGVFSSVLSAARA